MRVNCEFKRVYINGRYVTTFKWNGDTWFVLRHLADAYRSPEQTTALARRIPQESCIYVGVKRAERLIDFRPGYRDSLCANASASRFLFPSLDSEKNIFLF